MIRTRPNHSLSITVGAIFALAAFPPIYLGEIRLLVPLVTLVILSFGIVAYLLLKGETIPFFVYSVLTLFVLSLLFSTGSALLILGKLDISKPIILLVQYLLVIVGYVLASRVRLYTVAWVIVLYASIYAILLITQSLGYVPGANQVSRDLFGVTFNRAQLFFNQPNGAGAYLVLIFPISFLLRSRTKLLRIVFWVYRVILLFGLVATFSRSALIALIISGIVVYILQRFGRWAYPFALALLVAICLLTLYRPAFDYAVQSIVNLSDLKADYSASERTELMRAGIEIFYDHPIFGVGPGNYPKILPYYNSSVDPTLGIPHNSLIQFASEQGIFGVLAYIFMLVSALRATCKRDVGVAFTAWSFWAATLNGWFGWSFIHGLGELYMLTLGILLSYARTAHLQSHDSSSDARQGTVARG